MAERVPASKSLNFRYKLLCCWMDYRFTGFPWEGGLRLRSPEVIPPELEGA